MHIDIYITQNTSNRDATLQNATLRVENSVKFGRAPPPKKIYVYIYTGMDPARYFRGGARRIFTEFSTRSVAF